MRTPESWEKDEIKRYLTEIGAYFFLKTPMGFGASGAPDIVACIVGTYWGIEVKREGGQLSVLQERRMKEIICAGGQHVWGTSAVVIVAIDAWRRRKAFGGPIEETPAARAAQSPAARK